MKYVLKANKDTDWHYGDVHLEVESGKSLTLSSREAEIALHSGDFDFVKEITESDAEKELAAAGKSETDERRTALLEESHDELYKQAKDFPGVKKSMTKTELVDEILKPRAPVIADAQNTSGEGETEINKGEN